MREEDWVYREGLSHLRMRAERKKRQAICHRARNMRDSVSPSAVIRKTFPSGRREQIQRLSTVQPVKS